LRGRIGDDRARFNCSEEIVDGPAAKQKPSAETPEEVAEKTALLGQGFAE
jgi:hypothetical protein